MSTAILIIIAVVVLAGLTWWLGSHLSKEDDKKLSKARGKKK